MLPDAQESHYWMCLPEEPIPMKYPYVDAYSSILLWYCLQRIWDDPNTYYWLGEFDIVLELDELQSSSINDEFPYLRNILVECDK